MAARYMLTRLAQSVPVVFLLILINFLVIHLAPGDPASLLVGESSSPELIQQTRREFGLDRSLPEQFLIYAAHLLRGELGYSFRYRMPVAALILERLGDTLVLMTTGFLISVVIGTTLGVLAARRPGSFLDMWLGAGALVGYSLPVFWVGMLLILFFGFHLGWFPLQGTHTIGLTGFPLQKAADRVRYLILPSITVSLSQLALFFRLTRSRMIEELRKEYVTCARAKGLTETCLHFKHALRNASLTLVTVAGLRIGVLFSGAVLTEVVFAWPGIGSLMYNSMLSRDYPVLMGVFMMAVIVTVLANLLTDLSYSVLDPRVRHI